MNDEVEFDSAENREVYIRDGELWIPDAKAFCDYYGVEYIYGSEGDFWAGIHGEGDMQLYEILCRKDGDAPKLVSIAGKPTT